jgi:hypothetical protein
MTTKTTTTKAADEPELLDKWALAARLGCGKRTVEKLQALGILKPLRLGRTPKARTRFVWAEVVEALRRATPA